MIPRRSRAAGSCAAAAYSIVLAMTSRAPHPDFRTAGCASRHAPHREVEDRGGLASPAACTGHAISAGHPGPPRDPCTRSSTGAHKRIVSLCIATDKWPRSRLAAGCGSRPGLLPLQSGWMKCGASGCGGGPGPSGCRAPRPRRSGGFSVPSKRMEYPARHGRSLRASKARLTPAFRVPEAPEALLRGFLVLVALGGVVAEWSCSGLQSRLCRFDSDPRLSF
jgi:hypothetical protein